MSNTPIQDVRLYELGRAVDAEYCNNYAECILERLDKKELIMTDEKWRELADCLHKARCMLEHAYYRVMQPEISTHKPNKCQ